MKGVGGKTSIMVARPVTAGIQREEQDLEEQLVALGEEKLAQLKAGVDLNLQAKDGIIEELKGQYEGLL